jgi:hypothetical protein
MRRAGVPQVVRMKISGHKTDSMERRYNIVDSEDLSVAKTLLEQRMRTANVTGIVTIKRNAAIPLMTWNHQLRPNETHETTCFTFRF